MRKITISLIVGVFMALASQAQVVDFNAIKYWVGNAEGSNKAALIVKWNDDKDDENAMMWGYRWEGTATGLDMITAIAHADSRFTLLRQQTGIYGYTIDGIGFSETPCCISFDFEGAQQDSRINFKYKGENSTMGQTSCPENPERDIRRAIEIGLETGVIEHPFSQEVYGYAAYDYDYWKCSDEAAHWCAGWYDGYWAYYTKDSETEDFGYSGLGASSRVLLDGSVDGWSYSNFDLGISDMNGHYTAVTDPGGGTGIEIYSTPKKSICYGDRSLKFTNYEGYTFHIYALSGEVVGQMQINGENISEPQHLQPGIYLIQGSDGRQTVKDKFVVTTIY